MSQLPKPSPMTQQDMVALPSSESPTAGQDGGMAQPPADGFVRPNQQAEQPDPLMDDKALKAAALDHRGSRQIAPYGTYEAVDAAIQHGYYTGLEALDFGTLPDGTPAALFTDQRGQRQAIRMSQEQWSAGLQTRAQARIAMAKQMRNQQESQRLMPAVEKMAQELEAVAPGFMDFAAMNMETDPRATYSNIQNMYDKFKAGDRQVIRELAKAADQASLQVGQAQAESWDKQQEEMDIAQAEGVMDDESIPEEFKAQLVRDLRRKSFERKRFALNAPLTGNARRTASFPSWYASQSNPGAIDDLADQAINGVGYQNISGIPRPQQIQFLMQRAMEISRNIGWTVPFGQGDIAMVSNALDRRLQAYQPLQMMQPNQVAGNQAPEAQQIRGTMSQMQRSQQEREQATRMSEAKIGDLEARAAFGANRAAYAPDMSEADLALKQARGTSAQVDAQYAAQRQQARIAEMRARAAQGDAESERKLAEVDVLIGLTPEEAKGAKTQREAERKSRGAQVAPSSQPTQSKSAKEREQNIRTLAERYGVTMDNTGDIQADVVSTTKRLANDETMIGKMRYKSWIKVGSILANEK